MPCLQIEDEANYEQLRYGGMATSVPAWLADNRPEWPPNLLYAHAAMQRAAEQPARIPAAWDEPLLAALERGLVLARGGLSDDENVSLFVH